MLETEEEQQISKSTAISLIPVFCFSVAVNFNEIKVTAPFSGPPTTTRVSRLAIALAKLSKFTRFSLGQK
jgi:hypothetical protein